MRIIRSASCRLVYLYRHLFSQRLLLFIFILGEGYGVEGRIEVIFGVCLASRDVEGAALEGPNLIDLADCLVDLLELAIQGHIIDSKQCEVTLFALILAGGVIILDAHLFELGRSDDFGLQHLPDEQVSHLLYLAEVLVLVDFQVEQSDFVLLGLLVHSAEVADSREGDHCFLQDGLDLWFKFEQDGGYLLSGVLPVQNEHANGNVGQQVVALLEQLMRIFLVGDAPNSHLQALYGLSVWLVYEGQACEMRVFWKVADLASLHPIFFYKNYNRTLATIAIGPESTCHPIQSLKKTAIRIILSPACIQYEVMIWWSSLHYIHKLAQQTIPMLMHADNDPFRPCMPEVGAKLHSFHVEIRTRSLREYKQRIRTEFLSTAIVEELLESKPMDGQSAREWARQLGREYGRCEKYVLSMDKAVEVFKLVEKFPTKESLELLEVVTLRADRDTTNQLFQYDVMRLLHRFACCEGRPRGRENTPMEEVEMMREVVITESVVPSPSQQEKVQLARGAVRVIAQLCRKAQHIRNFAVLNHKTFNYCLKCLNVFGEDIKLEFCMFLEATTHYSFGRKGEDQYKRITNKIINCFFHQQLNIRIELFQDNQHNSCIKAYDFLINAVANLIKMGDAETVCRIMAARTSQRLGIIEQMASLVSRCAYVMDFPAVAQSKEQITPLCVVGSAIQLMLQLAQQLDTIHCPYNSTVLFQELYRFASLRSLPLADPTSILLRRGLYFLTTNRLYDALTEDDFHSMIFYSNDQQKNLVSLLAYYLQVQVDGHNVTELACTIKKLFQAAPAHMIEPLVLPSGILDEMMERMLNCDYIRNAQLVSLEQSINILLLDALEAFFVAFGHRIGQRVNAYKQIMMGYAERLYAKYDINDCQWSMTEKARTLLSICQAQQSLQQV